MDNGELFYDDEHQALRKVIEDGKGYKATAAHLFPDLKLETRYAKLKHAVNGTNGEVLRFSQVIEICRFNERYDAIFHGCDELGLHRPARKIIKDEKARLVAIIESASDTTRRAVDALEKLRKDEAAAPHLRTA